MRFVVLLSPGPRWAAGKSGSEQDGPAMRAHLVKMRALYDGAQLVFGGPFKTEAGGIAIIEAASLKEASAIMDADPAVIAGIIVHRVLDVRPYFDAFSGKAWSPEAPGVSPA